MAADTQRLQIFLKDVIRETKEHLSLYKNPKTEIVSTLLALQPFLTTYMQDVSHEFISAFRRLKGMDGNGEPKNDISLYLDALKCITGEPQHKDIFEDAYALQAGIKQLSSDVNDTNAAFPIEKLGQIEQLWNLFATYEDFATTPITDEQLAYIKDPEWIRKKILESIGMMVDEKILDYDNIVIPDDIEADIDILKNAEDKSIQEITNALSSLGGYKIVKDFIASNRESGESLNPIQAITNEPSQQTIDGGHLNGSFLEDKMDTTVVERIIQKIEEFKTQSDVRVEDRIIPEFKSRVSSIIKDLEHFKEKNKNVPSAPLLPGTSSSTNSEHVKNSNAPSAGTSSSTNSEHVKNSNAPSAGTSRSTQINADTSSERFADYLKKQYASFVAAINKANRDFFEMHSKFILRSLSKYDRYIKRWREQIMDRKARFHTFAASHRSAVELSQQPSSKNNTPEYTKYDSLLKDIDTRYAKSLEELKNSVALHFGSMKKKLDDKPVVPGFYKTVVIESSRFNKHIEDMPEKDDQVALRNKYDDAITNMTNIENKLNSMYNNKYSLMDMIMDSRFMSLYVLKVVHFCMILVALFLSEKIFSEMYMKKVYAQNADPPDLLYFLGIFIAVDAGFILFLITILLLVMFIFKTPVNDFVINGELIKAFLLDYVMYIILLAILAIIIGSIIQKKKYFRYKTEGLRAARAYKEILTSLAGILLIVPYFSLF